MTASTSRRAAAWMLAVLVMVVRLWQARREVEYGTDLEPVWRAANSFVHRGDDWRFFAYPPSALLFAAPMGALPYHLTRALFFVADPLLVVATVLGAARLARIPVASATTGLLTAAVFAYEPTQRALVAMNLTILMAAMFVGLLLLVERDQWGRASLVLGLSMAIKPMLVPALLVFLLNRRWREATAAVAVPLVLTGFALPFVVHPAHLFHTIRHELAANRYYPSNISVWGAVHGFHGPTALSFIVRAAVGVAVVVMLLHEWRRAAPRALTVTELTFVGVFLVSSFTWDIYMLALIPVVAVAARERDRSPWLWGGLLLTSSDWYIGHPSNEQAYASLRWQNAICALGLVMVGWWLVQRLRGGAPVDEPAMESKAGEPAARLSDRVL